MIVATSPHPINMAHFLEVMAPVGLVVGYVAWRTRDLAPGAKDTDDGGYAASRDLGPLTVRRHTPGRVTLGTAGRRLLACEPRASLLILGPSGSRKTTCLAAPAVREWRGPVVATSVKRDLAELSAGARRDRPVHIFDPTSVDTARWSPLGGCEDWGQALRMASWLVTAGQPTAGRSGIVDAPFFYKSAEKLLAPMLFAAATSGRTMSDVASWVDTRAFDDISAILSGAGSVPACEAWTATMKREARTLDSIVSTTETVISAFADPMVAAATSRCDFTAAEMLATGGTLYLIGTVHEQQRLRGIFVALVKAVLAEAYEHGPLADPLLLVLDEAANIAPVPDLDQVASTAAGLGIQLVTVFQDLAQMDHRYGERGRTIISNHRAVLALAGLKDLGTLRALSELVGDHDVPRHSRTRGSDGRSSQATATEHRRVAPVDAIRRMKPGAGLLIYGSLRPAKLKLARLRHSDKTRLGS